MIGVARSGLGNPQAARLLFWKSDVGDAQVAGTGGDGLTPVDAII